ncbi:hypothetical protein Tco_0709900 [Tanacetum coccineum]
MCHCALHSKAWDLANPDGSEYSPCSYASLSLLKTHLRLSQLHDPFGHRDVLGPGCLAAAAAELSPISHPGLGVVSSSLFRGRGVTHGEYQLLPTSNGQLERNVEKRYRCSCLSVLNPQDLRLQDVTLVMVHAGTYSQMSGAAQHCGAASSKILRWKYSKIDASMNRRIGNL